MSKAIIDRPVYNIMKYLYVFLITNFYFIISNILFVVVYYFADFTFGNILLFYLALIPMGPALTAVLFTMGKLVREKEVSPTSVYWIAYKKNIGISMKYWLLQLTVMFILMIDIYYATNNINILSPLFLVLLLFNLLIMMFAFPIIARFEVKLKNLLVISIYSIFKYFKITLLNATSIIAFGIIFYYYPSISTLFLISLIAFFMMYNMTGSLQQMEDKMSENN